MMVTSKKERASILAQREGLLTEEQKAALVAKVEREQDQRIEEQMKLIRQRHPSKDS